MCYHTSTPDERAIRKQFKSLGVEYKGDTLFHVSAGVKETENYYLYRAEHMKRWG